MREITQAAQGVQRAKENAIGCILVFHCGDDALHLAPLPTGSFKDSTKGGKKGWVLEMKRVAVIADEVRRLKDVILIGDMTAEPFKATADLLRKRLSDRYTIQTANPGSNASYSDCRIVAWTSRSGGVAPKPIKAIADVALLLIEQSEAADLLESFRDGVHYVSYCGPHELLAQITFYLKRQDLWHRISRAGRLHAMRSGSFDARMQQLLAVCAKSLSARESRNKPVADPAAANSPANPAPIADPLFETIPTAATHVSNIDCSNSCLAERLKPREAPAWRANASGPDLVLVREQASISLCMIVRDSVRTLGRCLRSIRPWVSEMIVVDTGSLDETPELARQLGARVFHFPWCCDFAAARNVSIRHASGRWVFWMDADDTIDGINGRRLMELAGAPQPRDLLGCVMQVHCPGGGHREDVTVVDHVKLFLNRPDLRFEGRIHEQILPAIRRAGGEVGWTDLYVIHSGADYSVAGRRRKFDRDIRLLHLELRDRPDHSFTLFNLGMTYADVGEHSTAVQYLRRSLEKSEWGESHIRKIYALLAASLSHLQKNREAYETCVAGLKSFPQDAELNFRAAIAAHRLGQLEEAERLYRSVIAGGDSRHFSSVDRGITGFKANYNLAGVYRDMGRVAEAVAQYQIVTQIAPHWPDGWRALLNLRIDCGHFAQAEQDLIRMSAVQCLSAEAAHLRRQLNSEPNAQAAVVNA